MRVLLLRGIFAVGQLADVAGLDSRHNSRFSAKVRQWREFLPSAPADLAGYLGARLSPPVFLFIGPRQQVDDWRVMALFALDLLMPGERHRDYAFLSRDMSVMRDDIPEEAYVALGCFHRDLLSANERPAHELEPAFIEERWDTDQAILALLLVPRAGGVIPGRVPHPGDRGRGGQAGRAAGDHPLAAGQRRDGRALNGLRRVCLSAARSGGGGGSRGKAV